MPPYYRAATKKYITGSSVTGPRVSIPLSVIPSPMSLFCPGSARGRHLMGSDEDRPANLGIAIIPAAPLWVLRPDLIHRPGDRTFSGRLVSMAARTRELSFYAASAAAFSATKVVPSTSIRCSTTASLRARATLALRMPARLANRIAQLFRVEPFTGRVRMTFAAS